MLHKKATGGLHNQLTDFIKPSTETSTMKMFGTMSPEGRHQTEQRLPQMVVLNITTRNLRLQKVLKQLKLFKYLNNYNYDEEKEITSDDDEKKVTNDNDEKEEVTSDDDEEKEEVTIINKDQPSGQSFKQLKL